MSYTSVRIDQQCRAPLSRGGECIKPKAPGSCYCGQHTKLIYGAKLSDATKRDIAAGLTLAAKANGEKR